MDDYGSGGSFAGSNAYGENQANGYQPKDGRDTSIGSRSGRPAINQTGKRILIRQGVLSKEIAYKLDLSIYTVNNYRKNILAKLNADNVVEAINWVESFGILY